MTNVVDIRKAKRDRVRVAMFTFAAAEADLAVASLTLCFLRGVSIVGDVSIAENADGERYIRDNLREGVYS